MRKKLICDEIIDSDRGTITVKFGENKTKEEHESFWEDTLNKVYRISSEISLITKGENNCDVMLAHLFSLKKMYNTMLSDLESRHLKHLEEFIRILYEGIQSIEKEIFESSIKYNLDISPHVHE